MIELRRPYLLFLGDVPAPLDGKTATGIAYWRPDWCLGQRRLPGCGADTGLPDMTLQEAAAAGAGTLIVGVAPLGGRFPEAWVGEAVAALEAGLDLAAGLHSRLADIPVIAEAVRRTGRQVFDIRHPSGPLACGVGDKRPGKRLLTVGTDTCVGKMFTALALEREMRARGLKADFRATGQTGIFIAGEGICVDAVVSDFISGAAEALSPANEPDHWDLVEGQGSLFHPAYAGVSLGLLHGAQPDALVLCHEAGRKGIDGMAHWPLPTLEDCMDLNLRTARLINPAVRVAGIALNTRLLGEAEAGAALRETGARLGLPCVDPVRTGVAPIVDALLEQYQ
ncbi:MAG: N-acetyltransferase DgcN [Kiloniellales bacterium]